MSEDSTNQNSGQVQDNAASTGSTTDNASWFIDEGVAGVGERPDWLPPKFKTVKSMADSYNILEKKFTAPTADYDLSKGEGWFNSEFEPLKELVDTAKKSHVSQEVIDKMLSSVGDYLNKDSFDEAAELAKLGEGYEQRIETIANWAKSNMSEKGFKALSEMAMSADDILAIEELRNLHMSNQNQIPTNQNTQTSHKTLNDLQKEMISNYDKYKTDKSYRDNIKAQMEKLLPAS